MGKLYIYVLRSQPSKENSRVIEMSTFNKDPKRKSGSRF